MNGLIMNLRTCSTACHHLGTVINGAHVVAVGKGGTW